MSGSVQALRLVPGEVYLAALRRVYQCGVTLTLDEGAHEAILRSLELLQPDETLLIQSGKPVGVFRTHADAPRVLLANSNLVPHWANWDHFHELDNAGLMIYGQMTAGSWIYIGVQGTYETFVEAGRQHYNGDLAGRWILTAGLGGAQPLAGVLAIECQESRIDFRLRTRYVDHKAYTLDDALKLIEDATRAKQAISAGLLGNAAEILPEFVKRARAGGPKPDIVTDQTSAHDPVNGYLTAGWDVARWQSERTSNPKEVEKAARASMTVHVQAMLDFHHMGIPTVDYGNNIRQVALDEGEANAFDFPIFAHCSARAKARSAGTPDNATQRISIKPKTQGAVPAA